ncbi:MAG: transglutaminase domain-containing protein [Firmicutes bacterium]|nr:transglutaminase domain-containing protein [Bacillota bacterium]
MWQIKKIHYFVLAGFLFPLTLAACWVSLAQPEVRATRRFRFNYDVHIPAVHGAKGPLRLWLPLPSSDAQQRIEALQISSPVPYRDLREPEFGNRYAYLEFSPEQLAAPQTVRIEFRAQRYENRIDVRHLRSANPDTSDTAALSRFLLPNRLVPIDGLVGELARQVTEGLDEPLAKVRAIYDYVVATVRYDKSGEGWGRGDAVFACTARRGNCTDFHSMFIGMVRAAGIPARFEIGFSLPNNRSSGEIPGYHCWAQFHLSGIGWVPVDASEAWKNPPLRDYFFGGHDPHRVLFSVGRDLRLDPAPEAGPLNFFIYPHAELDGKVFSQLETRFAFQDLPGTVLSQRSAF